MTQRDSYCYTHGHYWKLRLDGWWCDRCARHEAAKAFPEVRDKPSIWLDLDEPNNFTRKI